MEKAIYEREKLMSVEVKLVFKVTDSMALCSSYPRLRTSFQDGCYLCHCLMWFSVCLTLG